MAIFRFFKMAAAATLNFHILEILMVGTLKMAKLRHRAKFGRNRSNRGRDMAIFGFFQNGGRPPSWICDACVRTVRERHLVVFITVQNLVEIDTAVVDNMQVLLYRDLGLKTPIQALKLGFWGKFHPLKWAAVSSRPPKGTSLRGNTSYNV